MIQIVSPVSQYAANGEFMPATPGMFTASGGEEMAYRNWMTRRDAARQQIRRLSRRELQVVQLVSSGFANKSIALELQISVKTIEKHRANAARKLGVSSTAEMVRLSVLADHESAPLERPVREELFVRRTSLEPREL